MSPKPKDSSIANRAWQLAEPFAKELGLSLWDVRFIKEGTSWYLRYFIDKPEGVTIDDCERLSKAVDEPLDEADFIEPSYYLEVSSPGIDRRLTRPEHFELMKGKEVLVRRTRPINGKRDFTGILLGIIDSNIVIENDDGKIEIPKAEAAFVKLNDLFDTDLEEK